MPERDIIVVAASAGGVETLQTLVHGLPGNFPGSMFITLHFPPHGYSVLPKILSRAGPVPAVHASDGESIVPGRIYIAPPDYHLLFSGSGVRLVRGPNENGHRPAADPMFRSAALTFGPRVIGVVLTGNLDDGTAGLAAVKRHGGLAVVEDPESALFPSMPRSALEHVKIDRVVTARHMAKVLAELMGELISDRGIAPAESDVMENELAAGHLRAITHAEEQHPGTVSSFSCPDCGGVLWELRDGQFVRFRCRVGHAWTGDALFDEQHRTLDEALWVALRSLEESAALARQIAARQRSRGMEALAARFEAQAAATEARAGVVRTVLEAGPTRGVDAEAESRTLSPKRAS
jgi:two-component system, chemotaxis family, protein-glutamate methylesterase/glutaminase